jgi:hypothetical protein
MSLDRPGPVRLPKKKSTQSLAAGGEPRLSVIAEDGDGAPQEPKSILRPHHRPFSRIWNIGYPPRPSYEKSPPDYSELRDVPPTRMERLMMKVRSNKYVARRGGWKRLLCFIILVIALIIGLAVGLTVGLRNRNSPRCLPFQFPVGIPTNESKVPPVSHLPLRRIVHQLPPALSPLELTP